MAFTISYSFQHKRKKFSYCGWPLLNTEALNKQCTSMLKRYHVKLILYQRPCNTEGIVLMDSCKVLGIPVRSVGADLRPRNCSPYLHGRRSAPHDHATPFLTSLRLPALPWPRLGVNGLGTSRATILESGVVTRFEFFELQPFKVDQFSRGVFRDFLTLIKLKYIQK